LPRNFFRRIEVVFPVVDGILRERVIREILDASLADNTKARFLQPDGSYRLAEPAAGEKAFRSQFHFIALAQGKETPRVNSAERKRRFPQVRLAPTPAGSRQKKR
jgi:polyphosphate kinase